MVAAKFTDQELIESIQAGETQEAFAKRKGVRGLLVNAHFYDYLFAPVA